MSLDIDLFVHVDTGGSEPHRVELYSANITHNLYRMAEAAGIYKCVWRPDENGITEASQLIEPLTTALADMRARPEFYKQYDSPNGWGLYEHFVPWLERLLDACKQHPAALVEVSR